MKVIGYDWRLRELMASQGIFSTTKLSPLLEERGIHLSSSQVYRLVTAKPERLSLNILVALMDILNCTADDLIARVDVGTAAARTGTDNAEADTPASAILRERGLRPPRSVIEP